MLQEVSYAVGRFCCARLQMYHALMHYKHRLRGKLKKRIKAEYQLQKVSSVRYQCLCTGFVLLPICFTLT